MEDSLFPLDPENDEFGHTPQQLSALKQYLTTVDEFGNPKSNLEHIETPSEPSKTEDISNKPYKIMSVYTRHSRGGVEEIREKTFDGRSGKTHESHTRRIGDRWFRNDSITDANGEKTAKEVWHNIDSDEVLDFKDEWVARRANFPHSESGCLDSYDTLQ